MIAPEADNPYPENEMPVDQDRGDHLLGSKSRMISSGMVKSSARNRPASSPYLIGCRPGNGPRQATDRPLRVTTIASPACARATSAASRDLARATNTVVPNTSASGLTTYAPSAANRVEQPPAMANRCDAQVAQILGRQPAQNLPVDVVGTERRRVFFEPELAQPLHDVHGGALANETEPSVRQFGLLGYGPWALTGCNPRYVVIRWLRPCSYVDPLKRLR